MGGRALERLQRGTLRRDPHPAPMQKPASLSSPARTTEAVATPRTGQIPRTDRTLSRLAFFSLSSAASDEAWGRLGALGLGVAIALDPAERIALGWSGLAELVRRAGTLALPRGFVAGASSEQLSGASTIGEQLAAIAQQAATIEEAGGVPLVLPLAALSRRRAREDEYVEVYGALLARLNGPVIVDWTGPRARPELQDYFPGKSFERVMAIDPAKVRGARLALADLARETRLRRELVRQGQLTFTADRRHLGRLLLGLNPGPAVARMPAIDRYTELAGQRVALGDFSHALLDGSLAEAEALAAALERIEAGDPAGVLTRLE